MVTLLKVYAADPVAIDGIVMSRAVMTLAGLSSDEKPTGTYNGTLIANGSSYIEINTGKTYLYDEESSLWSAQAGGAGNVSSASMDLSAALDGAIASQVHNARVISLTGTQLASGSVIEAVGVPEYVGDVTQYAAYGITETGWYIFARVLTKSGEAITADVAVDGADGSIITAGEDHVDIAVRFEVASMSKPVTINWGTYTETYIFKATDLAVRNLDYRVTFYVYDADQFATWEFARTENKTFVGTQYFTEENGVYTQAAVKALEDIPEDTYYTHAYVLTEDSVFEADKIYYTKTTTTHSTYEENGMYTWSETTYDAAEVAVGEDVPAGTYYVDQWTPATGYFVGTAYYTEDDGEYTQIAVKAGEVESYFTKQVDFEATEDETYVGTEYWEVNAGTDLGYSRAAVKAGFEAPAEPSYYTHTYLKLTAAGKFAADTRYYKLVGDVYELQEVTVGASYAKNLYYIDQWTIVEAGTALVGTRYYIPDATASEGYVQVAVVAGEAVQADTYIRIVSWPQATDPTFETGVTYYINPTGKEYVEAAVTAGNPIPAYYAHSKVTFAGLTRNVTYRFNQIIDCPTTFILPEIEDECHGAWYEIRCNHAGTYSMTLVPPSDDVKVATQHSQVESAGINMINLHYTSVAGLKMWRFMNTHSSVPA